MCKSIQLIFTIILLIFANSCNEDAPVIPESSKYCPPPNDTTNNGEPSPIVITQCNQRVSPDGEKLLFALTDSRLSVLNLKTGKIQNIEFSSKLPTNIKYFGMSKAVWCPYNSNILLAQIVTSTDTVGDGIRYIWGQNLYIVYLNDNSIKRITPDILSPAGNLTPNFYVHSWLPGSDENNDLIQISYQPIRYGNVYQQIYIPQNQKFLEVKYLDILALTQDGKYIFHTKENEILDSLGSWHYNINDTELKLKDQAKMTLCNSSFSPDGKKLALSIMLDENGVPYYLKRYSEIWIIDVEKFMRNKPDTAIYPDKIINYRKSFCMYNYEAGYAEYITNDRLAVSMFHNFKDGYGFLYEITEDGQMVKQLTFTP